MSLSDVIRNIAKTVTDKDELKEKAKDFPLFVVQTTLSAAGQALLLVDRVKNSIKGLAGKEEEEYDSRPSAAEQVSAPAAEDKPARREPVIFAPRPTDSSTAEPNGTAKPKPEPVIFTPATKPASPEPVAAVEPVEPVVAEVKEPAAKPKAAPKPRTTAKAGTAKASTSRATAAKDSTAKASTSKATAAKDSAPKATAAKDSPAKASAVKPKAAAKPKAAQDEPLPGYSELTVASLRARMRGKSAEQIKEFLAYESATTDRPEVIKMFENRLAKLEAGE